MYTTTNYGFNIVEGTDIVNPLTQLNPNFTSLDTDLKAVADATVDNATCIKTGTVHAVTRTNTSANVFKFTATGDWNTGDTMTVDGTLVSVYASDGTAPANGCYVINTEVLAAIQGTRVTLYVNSGDASNISFDDTSVSFTANNVQTALESLNDADNIEYVSGTSVKAKIDAITNKNETVAIPNIGQHYSIKITLADNDTFCIATFVGSQGKNAMYVLSYRSNVNVFQNGYSITRDSDREFTITSTDYWSRALIQVFAPNPNAISYEILN